MPETSVAVQRAGEKTIAVTPVERLIGRVNKISQAISQRAYEIFEENGRRLGTISMTGSRLRWICFTRST